MKMKIEVGSGERVRNLGRMINSFIDLRGGVIEVSVNVKEAVINEKITEACNCSLENFTKGDRVVVNGNLFRGKGVVRGVDDFLHVAAENGKFYKYNRDDLAQGMVTKNNTDVPTPNDEEWDTEFFVDDYAYCDGKLYKGLGKVDNINNEMLRIKTQTGKNIIYNKEDVKNGIVYNLPMEEAFGILTENLSTGQEVKIDGNLFKGRGIILSIDPDNELKVYVRAGNGKKYSYNTEDLYNGKLI